MLKTITTGEFVLVAKKNQWESVYHVANLRMYRPHPLKRKLTNGVCIIVILSMMDLFIPQLCG
jgi:hypothetical protein